MTGAQLPSNIIVEPLQDGVILPSNLIVDDVGEGLQLPSKIEVELMSESSMLPMTLIVDNVGEGKELPTKIEIGQVEEFAELPNKLIVEVLEEALELPNKLIVENIGEFAELPSKLIVDEVGEGKELPSKLIVDEIDEGYELPSKIEVEIMQEFAELMLDYICNRPATESLTWVDLTLNSGWTVPSGFQKPQYALDPSIIGKVHFRGICNNNTFVANPDPTNNSSPLTLPSTIRPLLTREFHSCAFRFPNITGYDVSNWLNAVISIPLTGVFIPGVRYESTGEASPIGNFRFSLDGFSIETN
jgi:hypothetical protein